MALVHQQFLPQVVHAGYCQPMNELISKIERANVAYLSIGTTIYAIESLIPRWWVIVPRKESINPNAFDVAIKLANRDRQITITLLNFEILRDGGWDDAPDFTNEIQLWIELKALSFFEYVPDIFAPGLPEEFEKSVVFLIPRNDAGYIKVGKGETVDARLGSSIAFTFRERGIHQYVMTILVWDIDDALGALMEFIQSPLGIAGQLYTSFVVGGYRVLPLVWD